MTLPVSMPDTDAGRKGLPIWTGVIEYFPDALLAIAAVSKAGNDQHNPGQPLHWAREKSTDQLNTAARHLMQHGTKDSDGQRHTAKAAWRILAELQLEIEAERAGEIMAAQESAQQAPTIHIEEPDPARNFDSVEALKLTLTDDEMDDREARALEHGEVQCEAMSPEVRGASQYRCTRAEGHEGRHVAMPVTSLRDVWED